MPDEKQNPQVVRLQLRRLRSSKPSGLEQMEPAIEFIPDVIAGAKMYCASCEAEVPVPLKHTFPEPHTPVFTNDYHPITNNVFLQCVAVEVNCPLCSKKVQLQLPTKRWKKKVTFYGDEAIREDISRPFVCLTLVGGSPVCCDKIAAEVTTLKTELEPELDPTTWVFHMMDIHSGQRRLRHPVFAKWNREKCTKAVDCLFEIIRSANDEVFVFVCVYPMEKSSSITLTKRKVYMAMLCDTIYGFTRLEASPQYIFDAEKATRDNSLVIQQWARNSFLGSERQLMYLFLSHGVPVLEPQFVKPGSHICLELADFVAFVTARELYRFQQNAVAEYLTAQLGNVYYSWPELQRLERWRGAGVPADRILADTPS